MTKKRAIAPVSVRLSPDQREALKGIAADHFQGNESRAVLEALQAVYGPIMKASLADLTGKDKAPTLQKAAITLEYAIKRLDKCAGLRDRLTKRLTETKAAVEAALNQARAELKD